MFGSGHPMPYDISLICLLAALAIVMFVGAASTGSWSPATATLVRRAALLVGIAATVVVRVVTPTTNGIIGAGRVPYVVGGRRAGSL